VTSEESGLRKTCSTADWHIEIGIGAFPPISWRGVAELFEEKYEAREAKEDGRQEKERR